MVMEKRRYQRIPVRFSALVTTEEGDLIKVVTFEVSSHGLSLECNTKQRNIITPAGSFIRDGRPISVFVYLNLSDEDGQLCKIVARCHVVFSRRMSLDQCKIGLRFADFENNGQEQLIRFIEKTLAYKNFLK